MSAILRYSDPALKRIGHRANSVTSISAIANKLLQDNKLGNLLLAEEPERCRAVIGVGLNHVHLLANILSPYMPEKSQSILRQLGVKAPNGDGQVPVRIPDVWEVDALKPGHAIGTPELLFANIPAAKIDEWRDAFGGEELRKQKEIEAEKAAAKKAAREKEKEKRKLKKAAAAEAAQVPSGATTTLPLRPAQPAQAADGVTEPAESAEAAVQA